MFTKNNQLLETDQPSCEGQDSSYVCEVDSTERIYYYVEVKEKISDQWGISLVNESDCTRYMLVCDILECILVVVSYLSLNSF